VEVNRAWVDATSCADFYESRKKERQHPTYQADCCAISFRNFNPAVEVNEKNLNLFAYL